MVSRKQHDAYVPQIRSSAATPTQQLTNSTAVHDSPKSLGTLSAEEMAHYFRSFGQGYAHYARRIQTGSLDGNRLLVLGLDGLFRRLEVHNGTHRVSRLQVNKLISAIQLLFYLCLPLSTLGSYTTTELPTKRASIQR
jgi:hypothetical protein